jgi:ComF family protein
VFFPDLSTFPRLRPLQLLTDAAISQDCSLCLSPSGRSIVCSACTASLGQAQRDDAVISAFEYRFPLDRLVQRFKSGGDLAIGHWLARALAHRVAREPPPDLLVAPPLARQRLRERGFNQSAVLARAVAAELGLRHSHRGLRKLRETPAQQGLGARERRANLLGAFRCEAPMDGLRVAIVDDVFTTGATSAALALALREAGAAEVVVWTVARAPLPGS